MGRNIYKTSTYNRNLRVRILTNLIFNLKYFSPRMIANNYNANVDGGPNTRYTGAALYLTGKGIHIPR